MKPIAALCPRALPRVLLRPLCKAIAPSIHRRVESRVKSPVNYASRQVHSAAPSLVQDAAATPVHGAPFTNSITFSPIAPTTGGEAALQPAQEYTFSFNVPGLPHAVLRLHARDSLELVARFGADSLHVPVIIVANGRRLPPDSLASLTLVDLFGSAVEFDIDGARYSVNSGRRLSAQGSTIKRTLLRSYVYLACGAGAIVVSCALFWNAVVPPGHNRLKQMQRPGSG